MDRTERLHRRVADEIERAADAGLDGDALYGHLFATLAEALDLRGACHHLNDPDTAVPIQAGELGDPPGSFEESLHFEFERDDVVRFADLRAAGTVGVISHATGGRPLESPRFREMIAPAGAADELRVDFSDAFGSWGCLVVFGERRFSEAEAALVARVAPAVTRGLRRARTRAAAPVADDGGPGVLILDAADTLVSADRRGRHWLDAHAIDGHLPGLLAILAAQARAEDPRQPACARTCDPDGRWTMLDASRLDDGVAIIVQPAPEEHLLSIVLRANGLSAREREVATLAVRGRTTREIADRLHLSPWTVGDHLKAVFEKTGVHSRGELAALVVRGAAPRQTSI